MNKVIIKFAKTEVGYCGNCDILPGWIVASEGDFDNFKKEVEDSLCLYVRWAKEDGDSYPSVFDTDYEVEYEKFE